MKKSSTKVGKKWQFLVDLGWLVHFVIIYVNTSYLDTQVPNQHIALPLSSKFEGDNIQGNKVTNTGFAGVAALKGHGGG